MSKIKVLHIVAGDLNQGAARGAYWLHKGLIENGINSFVLNNGKINSSFYQNVININEFSKFNKTSNFIKSRLDIYIKKIYKSSRKEIFSTGLFGYNFLNNIYYKNTDIIHLHWINGGLMNLNIINKIKKPIVWTIRDMWPFTGGCHYSLDCKRYLSNCGDCFFLKSNKEKDLSSFLFNRKKKILSRNEIQFVGISDWISEEAAKSAILKKKRIKTIYNNIDTSVFKPYNRDKIKKELKINTEKKKILVGAINSKNKWKGFHYLKDALNKLDSKKFELLTFGKINATEFKEINLKKTNFGFVNNDKLLSKIYSISDVYVTTSIQEAFGKTVVEAMSCKTPVVCFDNSGPSNLITHKKDGYHAKSFSSIDLANGIKWLLNNPNYKKICSEARLKALKEFDYRIIARQYIELYKNKLK